MNTDDDDCRVDEVGKVECEIEASPVLSREIERTEHEDIKDQVKIFWDT